MTWSYATRRFSYMVLLLLLSSILSFIIINLPPGDFLTSYIMTLEAGSSESREELAAALRAQYGLDQPVYIQYAKWMGKIVRGDFGMSFEWNRPVKDLVAERIPMTLVVSISTPIVGYLIAIPVGIYSATHQYSLGDMAATVFGFIGMAVPNFLFALFLMVMFYNTLTSLGRPVLCPISERTLDVGQACGPVATPLGTADRRRHGQHRREHPRDASQPAR